MSVEARYTPELEIALMRANMAGTSSGQRRKGIVMAVSRSPKFLRPALLGIAAGAFITLGACGGGGDSTSTSSVPPTTSTPGNGGTTGTVPGTGTVAVLLTDAPTDAFCQILATVARIDLLGSGTSVTVFPGTVTVDLLAMRNYADFFAVEAAVPVGTYDKMRMTLSDLALVECDDAGVPEPASGWEHPKLPGNGKLDLNPRGSFEVVGGETMIAQLDLDMDKSLHLHQTGNGKWQFRPVIFVTIAPDQTRLVRVFGQVRDLGTTTFGLCPLAPVSSMDQDPMDGGHTNGGGDTDECLDVFTDGSTGVFDASGTPVGLDSVVNGDLLTAVGFLSRYDDGDEDSHLDDLRLDAVVLELGPLGTFERIAGTVISAPGHNDIFVFGRYLVPMPVLDATNAIDVLLQSGTRIFAIGSSTELTSAALQPGTTGEVDGVTDPATAGGPLRSSLIVLDDDATPLRALIDGTIDTIDAASQRLTIVDAFDASGEQCVTTKTDGTPTRYVQVVESANSSETVEIEFEDLAVGDRVDVYGSSDPMEPACVLADTIQQYLDSP